MKFLVILMPGKELNCYLLSLYLMVWWKKEKTVMHKKLIHMKPFSLLQYSSRGRVAKIHVTLCDWTEIKCLMNIITICVYNKLFWTRNGATECCKHICHIVPAILKSHNTNTCKLQKCCSWRWNKFVLLREGSKS